MSRRRKLKILVITTQDSDRQRYISELFSQPSMAESFEPPAFTPSVSSRALRNRLEFFRIANQAGLIPEQEWEAVRAAHESGAHMPELFSQCLKGIPVTDGRKGSKSDIKLHYSCELWFKAKTINRGRSVLACTLAHLIAQKRFTEERFDVLLEDNVRAPFDSCADLVWKAKEASERLKDDWGVECHFRFLGWLGSTTNLEYLLGTHSKKRAYHPRGKNGEHESNVGVFPFPQLSNLHVDLDHDAEAEAPDAKANEATDLKDDKEARGKHSKPGGNFIWGTYAYWISRTAYEKLLDTLRSDVGAMLWKGKRARYYTVKPIDKILPRQIMSLCGQHSVQVTTHPSFFRAPMLVSKIHSKWDPEFCKSTEFQLLETGLEWSNLWLSKQEQEAVKRRQETGSWTPSGHIEA